MDTYSILREFADSWVLLGMFAFFIGAGVWAFLPSQRSAREDASLIPFRNETPVKACKDNCEKCKSAASSFDQKGT
ncbi:cytochrome c oxidase cbb3-type subunit 4 [Sulfitobacter undariae]|uniref:Cytochrome c oxidase cbb3-type subunit 4 n=1 Tax=Sulfitobacter undariae TaxID=1563671 RepID=A0A7W6H0T6_9RHOB|nr:cbb3-type cytochrome c oxidase subunit 3 [Sulfitobacter undariae]MBB3995266.1 cytochrome c oxidase cbb3-type subunit 4 [Sulfitobacter undariae]